MIWKRGSGKKVKSQRLRNGSLNNLNSLDMIVEKRLYIVRYLYDLYASDGIDQPFTTFYQGYADWVVIWEEPMTKNFVSCALEAIELRLRC
jgi:hypothetical protein